MIIPTFFALAVIQTSGASEFMAPVHRVLSQSHNAVNVSLAGSPDKPYQPVVVEGGQYFVHLAIGTPPQRFFTQVSTTTPYTWVPDSSCLCPKICSTGSMACYVFCDESSECCNEFTNNVAKPRRENRSVRRTSAFHRPGYGECNPSRHRFNSSASTTYEKDGVIFETHFNDTEIQWNHEGNVWGVGFVGYDTVQLGTLFVKHATFGQATQIELRQDIQGVPGLGPSAASSSGVESLVVTAFKQGLIEQPVASILLTPDLDMPAITYGGKDDAYCGSIEQWHNISASSDAYGPGWFVNAAVSVGKATVRPAHVQFDFTADAGIICSWDYIPELQAGLGWDGIDPVDCNLDANVTVTVDAYDYVFPIKLLMTNAEVKGQCWIGLDGYNTTRDRLVIGGFFLTRYCQSLDIGGNRIGFSENLLAKQS